MVRCANLNLRRSPSESGFIVSAELALITTILVIGLIVGLVAVRDSLVAEFHDIAQAVGQLDQSFAYDGILNTDGVTVTEGSNFRDRTDRSISGPPSGGIFSANAKIGGDITPLSYLENDNVEGSALVEP